MPKYDVSVVGAGLGGLAAAALLSSRKKRTIVIERGESLNNALGVVEKEGCVFSAAPTLLSGFERGGELHELSASLGILQNVSALSPCYQVALPDRRITVFTEQSETLGELRREFPREINALMKFYRDLHKEAMNTARNRISSYLSTRRSAARFINKYRFSRELMTFFDIQALYFFQKKVEKLSLRSLITLCDTPPLHLHGGIKKLADHLYDIILQQGGEIRYNDDFTGLALDNRRVIGITTGSGMVEADTVLLTTRPPRQPSTLFVALLDEVVPIGMCQEVLFLPDYALPRDFIALSLSAKDDITTAPLDIRALSASFHSFQSIPAGKQELIDRISKLMPFLNDYLVFSEEYRSSGERTIPHETFSNKPFRPIEGSSLLSRGAKKNVYLLEDPQVAPIQVLSAVQQFVDKLM